MKKKFSFICALFVLSLMFIGCSNDDDNVDEPKETVALNMMNEDNGKTTLANTGTYIDNSNNFNSGNYWYIVNAGTSSLGTNDLPDLQNATHEAAVQPGHLYYLYNSYNLVHFPSGKIVTSINASYYKIKVDSPIMENNINKGAVVKYVSCYPLSNNLPKAGSDLGKITYSDEQLECSVPQDAEYVMFDTFGANNIDMHLNKGRLTIKLKCNADKLDGPYGRYTIYVRSGNVCSFVFFNIEY